MLSHRQCHCILYLRDNYTKTGHCYANLQINSKTSFVFCFINLFANKKRLNMQVYKYSSEHNPFSASRLTGLHKRMQKRTFNEAISRRPFSTKSMLSMFLSPESSFKLRGLSSLSSISRSLCSEQNWIKEKIQYHPSNREGKDKHTEETRKIEALNLPISSLAFSPAAKTASTGRGARADQNSYLDVAISAWIPAKILCFPLDAKYV